MAVAAESFRVEGAGVELAGTRWTATGERGVVVFLHGGGQTRHSWSRTAARLAADGWTAVALDARGHGDSEWDRAGDYSLDAFTADLVAFLATLDVTPVLVGASLGGIVALTAVGERLVQARALVLVDVVINVEQRGVERIRGFMTAHGDGFASLEEVAAAIAAYNPVRRRPRSLDGVRKNVRQRSDGRWYWHWDPAFMSISDEPRRNVDRQRLRLAAAQVSIPTLLVRGLQSDVVSEAGLADMLEVVPAAEVVEIVRAGHMVAGDDNDMFAGELEAFIARASANFGT